MKDCKKKTDAYAAHKEMLKDYSKDFIKDLNKFSTVEELAEDWLENNPNLNINDRVRDNYRGILDNHIIPMFGHYKISELNLNLIAEEYSKHFYGEYSRGTLRTVARRFSSMLNYAVKGLKILRRSPHEGVHLSDINIGDADEVEDDNINVYSDEDLQKIIEASYKKIFYYGIFIFLAGTGCRIGEASALTWDQVDYKNKEITFNKQVVNKNGNAMIVHHLKNRVKKRTIPMNDELEKLLKMIEEKQDKDANILGLVFPTRNYTLKNPSNSLTCLKETICKKNSITGPTTLHMLRHTFITMMLELGENYLYVGKIVGHKSKYTTLKYYAHVRTGKDRKSMETASGFIKKD
jgi:integrase